ncbi:hypothetical protein OIO90_003234 [Microbotryomycetes sp. JL221]|nr:hypothetical protein OIO90_003234 [Microbotryomycetes sp. JL221]
MLIFRPITVRSTQVHGQTIKLGSKFSHINSDSPSFHNSKIATVEQLQTEMIFGKVKQHYTGLETPELQSRCFNSSASQSSSDSRTPHDSERDNPQANQEQSAQSLTIKLHGLPDGALQDAGASGEQAMSCVDEGELSDTSQDASGSEDEELSGSNPSRFISISSSTIFQSQRQAHIAHSKVEGSNSSIHKPYQHRQMHLKSPTLRMNITDIRSGQSASQAEIPMEGAAKRMQSRSHVAPGLAQSDSHSSNITTRRSLRIKLKCVRGKKGLKNDDTTRRQEQMKSKQEVQETDDSIKVLTRHQEVAQAPSERTSSIEQSSTTDCTKTQNGESQDLRQDVTILQETVGATKVSQTRPRFHFYTRQPWSSSIRCASTSEYEKNSSLSSCQFSFVAGVTPTASRNEIGTEHDPGHNIPKRRNMKQLKTTSFEIDFNDGRASFNQHQVCHDFQSLERNEEIQHFVTEFVDRGILVFWRQADSKLQDMTETTRRESSERSTLLK